MILNKSDLIYFLNEDAAALGVAGKKSFMSRNLIWRFQIHLRMVEYFINTSAKNNPLFFPRYIYHYIGLKTLGVKLGFSIPPNCFGPGLSIAHRGTIVVNGATKIGANCRIHVCVNIGASGGNPRAPRIGNNVYIAPGAKIFGDIEIADDVIIGANAVVNKSFAVSGITVAGVPAKVINHAS
jgi:serine O-acetyltransferase